MSVIHEALSYTMSTLMFIPLIFYCFIPVIDKTKSSLPILILKIILAVFIMEISMFTAYLFSFSEITTIFNMILCSCVFFWLYQKEVSIERSHLWFIFVTAGLIGCFGYMVYHISKMFNIFDAIYDSIPELRSLIIQILFECTLIIILYYPTKKYLRWLVCHFHEEKLWRIAWVFPVSFIVLSRILSPYDGDQLFTGEAMEMYLIFLFVFLIIIIFLYIMFYQVAHQMVEKQEALEKNSYLEMQSEQYHRLQDHVQETKRIRHDFHHQLIVLARMLKNHEYSLAEQFLKEYSNDIHYSIKNYCEYTAINAVLNHYASLCHELKINTFFHIRIDDKGILKDIDICVLLGNLLENAVYSCNEVDHTEKKIEIRLGQTTSNIIVLQITNPYNGNIRKDGDKFLSSRHRGEGQGIKSVRLIAEKYNGFVKINYDSQQFVVEVLLNI